jgi:peptidylprolyl isomerase
VRRTPALLTATALLAVGLVGCSGASDASWDASCNPTLRGASALDVVDVSGSGTAEPTVQVRTPFHVEDTSTKVLERGDGPAVEDDTQLLVLDITIHSGATGEQVIATPYSGDLSRVFSLAEWTQGFPGLARALQCATEGSRLVVGMAPDDLAEGAAQSLGLAADESAVAVVDLRKVYLPKADGADQFNESHGLPTVVRAPDGRPGIIVPDATPPEDVVVQVLKRGDGAEITADDTARAHVTGVVWDTGEVFDTTWDEQPREVSEQTLPAAVVEALEGKTVGSQVLVVVPPSEGFGDEQQGAVPGGSTLVYVADLLGIDG